jgi:integrase
MWDNMWAEKRNSRMPKKATELSALAVSKLKAEGRNAVGGAAGLHLRIVGDSRTWVLRIMVGARRPDIGLGAYPEVSLADARQKALEHRRQARNGIDPIAQRKVLRERARLEAAKAKTFKECAKAYIEAHRVEWKNPKHVDQWTNTLETYAYPFIGDMPVAAVDTESVLKVLAPIWTTKTETATRLRGRVERILDSAKVSGSREGENPARWRGHLQHQLAAPRKLKKRKHHAALPYERIGVFMADLQTHEGMSARALEFKILTAARSIEVRGAKHSEIDLQKKTWTIPPERMKGALQHRVPLSDRAVALLKALPRVESCDLLFPSPRGGMLSDAALGALIDDMHAADKKHDGIGYMDPKLNKVATPHGTARSTFKDWVRNCKGTKYADEVSELALAHVNSDETRAAYARDELLPLRAKLMADWSRYCDMRPQAALNKVVPFNPKRA